MDGADFVPLKPMFGAITIRSLYYFNYVIDKISTQRIETMT